MASSMLPLELGLNLVRLDRSLSRTGSHVIPRLLLRHDHRSLHTSARRSRLTAASPEIVQGASVKDQVGQQATKSTQEDVPQYAYDYAYPPPPPMSPYYPTPNPPTTSPIPPTPLQRAIALTLPYYYPRRSPLGPSSLLTASSPSSTLSDASRAHERRYGTTGRPGRALSLTFPPHGGQAHEKSDGGWLDRLRGFVTRRNAATATATPKEGGQRGSAIPPVDQAVEKAEAEGPKQPAQEASTASPHQSSPPNLGEIPSYAEQPHSQQSYASYPGYTYGYPHAYAPYPYPYAPQPQPQPQGAPIAAAAAAAGSAPQEVKVIVEEARGNVLLRSLGRLLGFLLTLTIGLSVIALIVDASGAGRAAGKIKMFTPEQGKDITFKDVHGCEEAKDELQEIVEFLKDPARFNKLGGKLPRGVLMTGPPGTGKTLLARAIAGEAKVPFFYASGSDFDEMYVGVGAKRMRELFENARKQAPSIVFLDELDAVGGKRSGRDQAWARQTLNQLLVELDGFSTKEGVMLVAATNFPQSLDKALLRPGRFDKQIAVPLPDARGRLSILEYYLKKINMDKTVDISRLARGTPGMAGADLQNLVNTAAVKASREGASAVNTHHFEWAKDRIMIGAERKSAVITAEEKRKTAYHEGGHAIVSIYTEGSDPLHKVTVLPRGHALGITFSLPEMDRSSQSKKELNAILDKAFGGRIAEELLYGSENVSTGASSDIRQASDVARQMVTLWGFSDKVGAVYHGSDAKTSPQVMATIDDEVRRLLDESQSRARKLLTEKRHELELLADALVEYETLDGNEVKEVIKGRKLSREI